MNCKTTREKIDAWLDDDVDRAELDAFRAHLETCDECARHAAAARRVREAVAELPRTIEPDRDLWDGIRERVSVPAPVGRGARTPRWAIASVAASVILAATLAVVVLRDGGGTSTAERPPAGQPDDPAAMAILASYDAAEDEFRETRDLLLAELESKRDQLDPETVEVVEDNLEIMNRAAAEIRAALQDDPENRMLRSMLLASYRKQVGLLKHFGEIPSDL